MQEPDYIITTSGPRRVIALIVLLGLGGLLLYLAMARPPEALGWQVFLLGTGLLVLIQAERFRRSSALSLLLWPDRLEDSTGRLLCRMDEITKVERGTFAFKPSNGFVLLIDGRHGLAWAPGLWWRIGRRVGVGGVTPVPQTKAMADMLSMRVAERLGTRRFTFLDELKPDADDDK
ncbi:hypothetical protein BV394_03345 [Brevirhabdus pacifica]|uniref:Uncharacterized protein n=1 Tax=Brevirhabdus pacifica TaxID=1267768 RepID=A0A1U7DFY2_9RHOB|nr:hypothetical protein [Brevirhabdus pacifica]APX88882.1 hypothetical protein BV394_03345 [Brevirhabdus pacifica]PJJ86574.1 hypothetical protein CLV77_1124 [Brevirhabdus pacifica]